MTRPHSRPRARFSGVRLLSALAGSLVLLSLVFAGRASLVEGAARAADSGAAKPSLIGSYGRLPLSFEENRGQTDRRVRFVSRGQGYALFLTPDEAVLRLRDDCGARAEEAATAGGVAVNDHERGAESDPPCRADERAAVLRIGLEGARRGPRVRGAERLAGESNYFVGAGAGGWRTRVPRFAAVEYESVYPGVDLVYYGNQRQLEYDFRVAPGADPGRIAVKFGGAESARVDERGDLVLGVAGREVIQRRPFAYQERGGERREVESRYVLREDARAAGRFVVGFELGAYDRARPLVIDPVLVYSTFVGGTDFEQGLGVAVDAQGSAYVTGSTTSLDFPTAGGVQPASGNFSDAFVLKLNPAGTAAVYATYLGGNGDDVGNAVAVDAQGSAYVVGFTGSGNFPITFGAVQTSRSGSVDGFVSKLDPSGSSLVYSTFVGGNNSDTVNAVAVDAAGSAYFAGRTESNFFTFFGVPPNAHKGHPVYRSTDAAANWSPSHSGMTSATVNVLAADPTNPSVVYAGTTNGLFKSTDGGSFWTLAGQASPGTAPLSTLSVAVDPNSPNVVYAGTNGNGGVYKSIDGGNLFIVRNSSITVPVVNALIAVPTAPGVTTLYAGTNVTGVYRSTDGAGSWTPINSGLGNTVTVNELAYDPSNPSVIYAGTNVGVAKTVNGGNSWTFVRNNGPDEFTRVTALAVDPSNPSTLYAGTANGVSPVFKTTDGGASWNPSGSGIVISGENIVFPINSLSVSPAAPATVYAAMPTGGIYKSTDGGATWATANAGLQNAIANAVLADAANASKVLAGFNTGGDGFVGKLNAAGSQPVYFGLLGGSEQDNPSGIAVDAQGRAHVTGTTSSTDFPSVNAVQPSRAGVFADAFVTKFSPDGQSLVYSTYLGGTGNEAGRAVAVGPQGHAHVTGQTFSSNFPLAQPADSVPGFSSDAFVTKLGTDGQSLVFSTYLGGNSPEVGNGIAVDARGNVYVVGNTGSINDFLRVNPTQSAFGGGNSDAFVVRYNTGNSTLDFATFLGGNATDAANAVAVDAQGGVYVVGNTASPNFPLVNPLHPAVRQQDAFVTKFGINADLALTKRDSRDPVMVNNQLTYTLTVVNNGTDPAANVRVSDPLPAGVTFVSATPSEGTCSGTSTVNCDLGELLPGETATVVVMIRPTAVGTISNTATVTSDTPDLDASNNTATQQTRVSDLPSIAGRVTTVTTGQFGGQVVPLAGVTLTLTGGHPDLPPHTTTTVTDAEGRYQFADLAMIGHYTVTPSRAGFVFNPGSQTFSHLVIDVTADFVAVGCSYAITPSNQSFPAEGGTGTINVTTSDPRCLRTATPSAPWISITSGGVATGSGPVTFSVAPTNASRSGTINVSGQVFTVRQEFRPCGEPGFFTALPISGAPPGFAALEADFNNDNKTDFAVAGSANQNNTVTVLLNDGGGRFRVSATLIVFAARFRSIAAGDFNGDGKQDLVTVAVLDTAGNGEVSLRLGDGAGNFGKATDFAVGLAPAVAAAGDFNGDGRQDLAVAQEGGTVSVLLGHATDGFSPAAPVGPPNSIPQALFVVTADFDRDGKADLAVLGGSGIYFLRGDGAGNFAIPKTVSDAGVFERTALATGDVNGDGNPDLAVAGNNVTALIGDGAGGFAAPQFLASGRLSFAVVIKDFNGDGRGDVVAARDDAVLVFAAAPANAFAPVKGYVVGVSPTALAAGDFDGDGRQDLISVDSTRALAPGVASHLMRGDGAGNFVAARAYATTGIPQGTAAADFNGDGRPDLLAVTTLSASYLPATATPGEFGTPVNIAAPQGANSRFTGTFSAADFNRDGKPDLALLTLEGVGVSESHLRVFLNDGAGAFAPASNTTLEIFNSTVLFDDFNGDGNPDLVSHTTPVSTLVFRPGDGAGGFGSPVTVSPALPSLSRMVAGDFNGDGRLDIATGANASGSCHATGSSQVSVLLGDGAGRFSAPTFTQIAGGFTQTPLAHDLNGDGRSDLVVADCFRSLRVLFARAGGGFDLGGAFGFMPPNGNPQHLALGDINGDGKPDLVVTEGEDPREVNRVYVLPGDGAGGFLTRVTFFAGIAPASVTVADLDGNGRDDLALAISAGGNVATLLNSCPVPAATSVQFAAATFNATEGTDRSVTVTVTRGGDTAGETFVSYATADGTASERKDYTAALGRLRFAAGETSKTFEVVITDDRFQEGAETFTVTLSDALGASLGAQTTAAVTINSDDAAGGPSPVKDGSFDTEFFVRQHYADFLNRVPDAGGLAFWMENIESCGADQQCREVKKVNVSAAFFLSIEFQETGFLAYRAHKAAFGDLPGKPVPVRLRDFLSDSRQIGEGVIVGTPGWPEQLEANKQAYFNQFVTRPGFATLYPQSMNAAQFVDALFARAGVQPTQAERGAAVSAFGAGGNAGRAAALRSVAESQTLKQAETNKAFVLMQYFGYLRRNPDDPQDTNFDGFFFWLGKLNQFNGNFVEAEMVRAFISSIEYGDRFGH